MANNDKNPKKRILDCKNDSGAASTSKQRLRSYSGVVRHDALKIVETLGLLDQLDSICAVVEKIECNNRVGLLVDEILETSWASVKLKYSENNIDSSKNNSEEATDLFSDVDKVVTLIRAQSTMEVIDPNEIYRLLEQVKEKKNRVTDVVKSYIEQNNNQNINMNANIIDDTMFHDVRIILDSVQKKFPGKIFNPDDIYNLLELRKHMPDRINFIINQLVAEEKDKMSVNHESTLVNEVGQVLQRCPLADPNQVYVYLEENQSLNNRVEKVVELILKESDIESDAGPIKIKKPTSVSLNNLNVIKPVISSKTLTQTRAEIEHALLPDIETVSKAVPNVDRNLICNLLEPLQDNPSRAEIVIEQLLLKGIKSDGNFTSDILTLPFAGIPEKLKKELSEESLIALENDAAILRSAFPLCDPIYIYERLSAVPAQPVNNGGLSRVQALGVELAEYRNYPTMQERIDKQKKQARIKYLMNMSLNLKEFLAKFPEPVQEFTDESKTMTTNYCAHLEAYLFSTYSHIKFDYIKSVMFRHNNRLSACVSCLETDMKTFNECEY